MAIEIPWQELSSDALDGIISSVIDREGTDYGESEVSFESKKAQLMLQLKQGRAIIVFDEEQQSCNLLMKDQYSTLEAQVSAGKTAEDEYFDGS